jgi:hypothetical protein
MTASYTLYVARDKHVETRHDLGSVLCMQTLEYLPSTMVEVVSCDTMTARARPSWLIGTPTLHALDTGEVWRGHQAHARLQRLAVDGKSTAPRKRGAVGGGPGGAPRGGPPSGGGPAPRGGPPSGGPGDEAVDDELDGLWGSTLPDEEETEGVGESHKLTSEDLARVLQTRPPPTQLAEKDAPSLPPMKD